MDKRIKDGATLMVEGLRSETKKTAVLLKKKLDDAIDKFDADQNGKINLDDITAQAKDGMDKLSAMLKDENIPLKARVEMTEVLDKIKPLLEAGKMQAEIAKEKIEAEIKHLEEVEELKEEVESEKKEAQEEE